MRKLGGGSEVGIRNATAEIGPVRRAGPNVACLVALN